MTSDNKPIRFTHRVDDSRSFVLRGNEWFVLDVGHPERLWSWASGWEPEMADEIDRLRKGLLEIKRQCGHILVNGRETYLSSFIDQLLGMEIKYDTQVAVRTRTDCETTGM